MLGPISIVGRTGLIAGPALFVIAALVSLFDIDRATDRWYDSWVEGTILLLGVAFFAAGLLYAAGVVAERDRRFGIVLGFTAMIGAVGMAGPSLIRIVGSVLVEVGVPIETLDEVFGDGGPPQGAVIIPFLGMLFVTEMGLAVGLWRASNVTKAIPVFIVLGEVLFITAQSSFEVNEPLYVIAVSSWLIGYGLLARRPVPATT
jgi:hypothetical protein